ncbi:hypothetical protein AB669_04075 [Pedobacter sp. BMA]|nr:hypothetical protein AB669_04075 [Pedobacter sp. BMA]
MEDFIIIISTDVRKDAQLKSLKELMNTFAEITEWTLDLEDCDKVLRIVSNENIANQVISKLFRLGIQANVMAVYFDTPIYRIGRVCPLG